MCRKYFPVPAALLVGLLQAGCASTPAEPACPAGRQNLPDCPPLTAIVDEDIERIYEYRTWKSPQELARARDSLATLEQFELLKPHLDHMDDYMKNGFYPSDVRLAHGSKL